MTGNKVTDFTFPSQACTSQTAPGLVIPYVLAAAHRPAGTKVQCERGRRGTGPRGPPGRAGRGRWVYPRTVYAGGTSPSRRVWGPRSPFFKYPSYGSRWERSGEEPGVWGPRPHRGPARAGGGVAAADNGVSGRRVFGPRRCRGGPHAPSAGRPRRRPRGRGGRRARQEVFFFLVKLWPREPPPIHFCANRTARTDPERGHDSAPPGRFITRRA